MFQPSTIRHRLAAIGLILLMQGPAMLVQEVAWVKMLCSYTLERGLMRGVIETFDGRHPCGLCRQAAEIRKQEQSPQPADKQAQTQRQRLVWAEMISSELLKMPSISGHETPVPRFACAARNTGRGADAPGPPPPEMA
jgi:hypothetical protein